MECPKPTRHPHRGTLRPSRRSLHRARLPPRPRPAASPVRLRPRGISSDCSTRRQCPAAPPARRSSAPSSPAGPTPATAPPTRASSGACASTCSPPPTARWSRGLWPTPSSATGRWPRSCWQARRSVGACSSRRQGVRRPGVRGLRARAGRDPGPAGSAQPAPTLRQAGLDPSAHRVHQRHPSRASWGSKSTAGAPISASSSGSPSACSPSPPGSGTTGSPVSTTSARWSLRPATTLPWWRPAVALSVHAIALASGPPR